jgi:hypothetical protein
MSNLASKVSLALPGIGNQIDKQLEEAAGERLAFTLVVYTPERANYIGNCNRDEAAKALAEMLNGWNAGMPDIPAHKISG